MEATLEVPCFHPMQPKPLCLRIQNKPMYEILLLVSIILTIPTQQWCHVTEKEAFHKYLAEAGLQCRLQYNTKL